MRWYEFKRRLGDWNPWMLRRRLQRERDYIEWMREHKWDSYTEGPHTFYPVVEMMVLDGPVTLEQYRNIQGRLDDVQNLVEEPPLWRMADDDIRPDERWLVIKKGVMV